MTLPGNRRHPKVSPNIGASNLDITVRGLPVAGSSRYLRQATNASEKANAHPTQPDDLDAMPSDLSYWLVSAPLKDGDPNIMLEEVRSALGSEAVVGGFEIPELKVSTHGV